MTIPAGPPPDVTREALTKRKAIPHMKFRQKNGLSQEPATGTTPFAHAGNNAATRFAVTGNAVVSGGTGMLGLAACRSLLEHGASGLAILDLNVDGSTSIIEGLKTQFPAQTVVAYEADVTNDDAVGDAIHHAAQTLGSIDHLFCFSGVVGCMHSIDMTPQQWRRILDVNTSGAFICAQAVAKKMIDQGSGGSITFIASISAHRVNYPQPQAAYNVSKAAVLALKNCLAAEWAQHGIRVNSISPGYMDTILNEGEGLAATRAVWQERNPMGSMGTPSELTAAVVMLASAGASYINGTDILVDGGGHVL